MLSAALASAFLEELRRYRSGDAFGTFSNEPRLKSGILDDRLITECGRTMFAKSSLDPLRREPVGLSDVELDRVCVTGAEFVRVCWRLGVDWNAYG